MLNNVVSQRDILFEANESKIDKNILNNFARKRSMISIQSRNSIKVSFRCSCLNQNNNVIITDNLNPVKRNNFIENGILLNYFYF
jgi:hypothetical protein